MDEANTKRAIEYAESIGDRADMTRRMGVETALYWGKVHIQQAWIDGLRAGHLHRDKETDDVAPEPVAVEDITPGWYWFKNGIDTLPASISQLPNGEIRVHWLGAFSASENLPIGIMSKSIKWYRAPSPGKLMAMCGGESKDDLHADLTEVYRRCRDLEARKESTTKKETNVEVVELLVCPNCRGKTTFRLRQPSPRYECDACEYSIPNQVFWRLAALEQKVMTSAPEPVEDKLANTRPCGECANWSKSTNRFMGERFGVCCAGQQSGANLGELFVDVCCQKFTEKPTNTRPCGECENWGTLTVVKTLSHARICNKCTTGTCVVEAGSIVPRCQSFTKTPVETCGECGNYNAVDFITWHGQCMARGGYFKVAYCSSFATRCKFATPETPKAREPATEDNHEESDYATCATCERWRPKHGTHGACEKEYRDNANRPTDHACYMYSRGD